MQLPVLLTVANWSRMQELGCSQELAGMWLSPPIIPSLRWLLLKFRMNLKILLITYKAPQGQAPAAIADPLRPHELQPSDLLIS